MSLVAAAVLAATLSGWAGGGDVLYPVRDRYEPGQEVTMVGRTNEGDGTWRSAGSIDAWLAPVDGGERTRVGRVAVDEPADAPDGRTLRLAVTFVLPADLAPGSYWVDVDPRVGWMIGGTLQVGVDPAGPVVRDWPLSEPAIGWLDDEALLVGPDGRAITAADVRAGRIPPPRATLPTVEPHAEPVATTAPVTAQERPASSPASTPASRRGGEEVVPWLVAGVAVLAVWCGAWRLRPRITVR
ncbi:MAG TPA: hypothetical protein VFM27_05615 [Acidimicrobiales bacterium]|nr:hypothetical protein [Acidimicrobiales bacterium]